MSLDDVFGPTGHISWVQECARAVLILFYGLVIVRMAGRRAFGKWAALDIIVSIIIGSNLSRALTGNAPLWGTLVATALLMLLHWMLAKAAARYVEAFRRPSIPLGQCGAADLTQLKRHSVSQADLDEALRSAGLETASRTRRIVLEPSGKISVLRQV